MFGDIIASYDGGGGLLGMVLCLPHNGLVIVYFVLLFGIQCIGVV